MKVYIYIQQLAGNNLRQKMWISKGTKWMEYDMPFLSSLVRRPENVQLHKFDMYRAVVSSLPTRLRLDCSIWEMLEEGKSFFFSLRNHPGRFMKVYLWNNRFEESNELYLNMFDVLLPFWTIFYLFCSKYSSHSIKCKNSRFVLFLLSLK